MAGRGPREVVYFYHQLTRQLEEHAHAQWGGNNLLPLHEQISPVAAHQRKFYCKCCDKEFWVHNARTHWPAARHLVNVVGLFAIYVLYTFRKILNLLSENI